LFFKIITFQSPFRKSTADHLDISSHFKFKETYKTLLIFAVIKGQNETSFTIINFVRVIKISMVINTKIKV